MVQLDETRLPKELEVIQISHSTLAALTTLSERVLKIRHFFGFQDGFRDGLQHGSH